MPALKRITEDHHDGGSTLPFVDPQGGYPRQNDGAWIVIQYLKNLETGLGEFLKRQQKRAIWKNYFSHLAPNQITNSRIRTNHPGLSESVGGW